MQVTKSATNHEDHDANARESLCSLCTLRERCDLYLAELNV